MIRYIMTQKSRDDFNLHILLSKVFPSRAVAYVYIYGIKSADGRTTLLLLYVAAQVLEKIRKIKSTSKHALESNAHPAEAHRLDIFCSWINYANFVIAHPS